MVDILNYEEFAEYVQNDIKAFMKSHEVIESIEARVITIISGGLHPWQLNQIQLELAALNARLGTILSEWNNNANIAISFRKLKRVDQYCKFKATIDKHTNKMTNTTDAGVKADKAVQDDIAREVKYMGRYNKCKQLYEDTTQLIMSLQTYLKHVKQEEISQAATSQMDINAKEVKRGK